ncbi:nucleolar protein 9 [Apus apus]|uniref:nucleolar protein 9 n=1 Tax=Apus apus TaxID=8895 RepID=UPI0021F866C8|nr:nucleolar protein 9 [Apus apus]
MGLRGRLRRPGVPGPGRGSRLDPDSARYFRRALETLREGLSPEELEPPKGAGPKRKGAELPKKGVERPSKWAGLPGKGAELPPSFPPLLGQLAEAFEEHLPSLLAPPCASLCLQGALRALGCSQSERCARLCHALIGRLAPPGPAHDQSPALAQGLRDPQLGRALEEALGALDPPSLRGLFREGLRGHLRGVASHPLANHGLQRLLDHAPEDVVGEVLQELGPSLGEPLARGCPGVLVALAGAARRNPALQPEALRCLLQAFGCWAPSERRRGCVGALGRLRPWPRGKGLRPPWVPSPSRGPCCSSTCCTSRTRGWCWGGWGP